jgi:spermidine synthase
MRERHSKVRKVIDLLFGANTIDEKDSPINGRIAVMNSIGLGTYIRVGGLTQSGRIIKDIWNKGLKRIKRQGHDVRHCLILGLGGGSVVEVVKKYWPDAKVRGVDIDSVIVDFGKKYLNLGMFDIDIKIMDAFDFLVGEQNCKLNNDYSGYDLILIDLYKGDKFPDKFQTKRCLIFIRNILSDGGIAIFNRLYCKGEKLRSDEFGVKLAGVFGKVYNVYPQANVLYLCYK